MKRLASLLGVVALEKARHGEATPRRGAHRARRAALAWSSAFAVTAGLIAVGCTSGGSQTVPPVTTSGCTADADCPDGQWCATATSTCVPGCKKDGDCTAGGAAMTCDLSTHSCVGCTADANCPAGQLCSAQRCVPGCTDAHACDGGKACCGGACFDTTNDVDHCGGCGACPGATHASLGCTAGACTIVACDKGFTDCDKTEQNGCEVSTDGEAENCGACGTVCALASATARCSAGACVIGSCSVGRADCNTTAADGCEVDLRSDVNHCGDCATACPAPPGATPSCVAGACHLAACKSGFADCDKDTSNGCEIDLQGDVANCGSCGKACFGVANAAAKCSAGVCGVGACNPGFADCDGYSWNGCETNIGTDPANCGACGAACPAVASGALTCNAGVCGGAVCSAGHADCDAVAANGCEVDISSDAVNCGVCANKCPALPHAAPACASFACGMGACDAGYADCFGGTADGCETSLLTDPDHCGACTTPCAAVAHGSRACAAATCAIGACDFGHDDCNKALADGCEVALATDANNCGTCGNVCAALPNALPACSGSACGLGACKPGFSDCDGNPANGCEFDTSTDPNNCGGCGVKCGAGACVAGACVCSKKVLLIADDSAAGSATLGAALTAAGYSVTQTAVPSYQYNGTNPALAGFGSVVLLAGGPASTSYQTDMPVAGQTAIANYVAAGNGLVLTEWATYQVASGHWATLAPLVLFSRTAAYSGQITAVADPARTSHPIWAGLPSTFTFSGTGNVGAAIVGPGISVLANSPQTVDLVAIRDVAAGRVVHFATAGNYAPNGWTNANVQKLMANAAGWVARCQ